jgi:hypothetical protein
MKKFKPIKNSFADLRESLWDTITNEWLRLLIILFFIGVAVFFWQSKLWNAEEEAFHVLLEFVGVGFIFLVVEHGLRKLETGLEDPKFLPVDRFLRDLGNSRKKHSEVIIFDTFLETVLLDENNCNAFRSNLKKVMLANITNANFSCKILCLKPESDWSAKRADDRNDIFSPEDYKNRMIRAMDMLKHIKSEICQEVLHHNDGKDHEGKKKEIKAITQKIVIREYDREPPFSMYSINNYAYISFYQIGIKSTSSRQLYAPADTEFGKNIFSYFKKTFSEIWDAATEIKPEENN